MADYNRRFARRPRDHADCLAPRAGKPRPHLPLRSSRVVSHDNVVQWEGQRFQIPQQARRFSFAGAKVHIYQALDGSISLYHRDTVCTTLWLRARVTFSCCR
jgi:hypothetical protein